MRAYRRRPWAAFTVDMTPLIDVVFLIIIFFIILINFSEMHLRKVQLPKADQAQKSSVATNARIPITVKSKDVVFYEREEVHILDLPKTLRSKYPDPGKLTVQIRANADVPYGVIKRIMLELAQVGIARVEFSAWQEAPDPLTQETGDEA